ncbi:hypothetical protein [Chroococcidiopsis sp. CCMEE 29]|uniref:hypothetical protein n=1 Tax=Chroococcidiopsis sp. CCMEE 29 TaxID=155894 RepID=UPI0020208C32|nr:hypothetical protein [Chroococcidiopsis sp. CCMEE 29]
MTHKSLLLIDRNTRWSHQQENLIMAAPVSVQAPKYDWTGFHTRPENIAVQPTTSTDLSLKRWLNDHFLVHILMTRCH